MMTKCRRATLALAFGTLGLLALGQAGSAEAAVINTYPGAQCQAASPTGNGNLSRTKGRIRNSSNVNALAICPIVKNIFNSTNSVIVGPVATGGTLCKLESFDVFTEQVAQDPPNSGDFKTFPGQGISAVEFRIPKSFRGGIQLRCFLSPGDEIWSYGVTEN